MAILKNVEIWHPRLDPRRPNDRFNKLNPTWEVQMRTTEKSVKKEWEEMGLFVKAIVPDEGKPYWRVNLKKKTGKTDGTKSKPVKVIDGKMNELDPNTIGNGSIANVRVLQREYTRPGTEEQAIATTLMGVQVTRLVPYNFEAGEDFQEDDFQTDGEAPWGDDAEALD